MSARVSGPADPNSFSANQLSGSMFLSSNSLSASLSSSLYSSGISRSLAVYMRNLTGEPYLAMPYSLFHAGDTHAPSVGLVLKTSGTIGTHGNDRTKSQFQKGTNENDREPIRESTSTTET